MNIDAGVIINKLSQKIASLELDNLLKETQIELLQKELSNRETKEGSKENA
jgi:hypothetical protein